MITCHLMEGKFETRVCQGFDEISRSVDTCREALAAIPLDAIIKILDALGKRVLKNPEINTLPGVSYISLWLRRENLDRICRVNYSDKRYLDGFCQSETNVLMMAQPRGIVCHWIAANMPTLGFFSIVQAILSKNGSMVKMPGEYVPLILSILRELPEISVDYEGTTYSGKSLLNAIAIVTFEGRSTSVSEKFSLAADCRIIFGGSEAFARYHGYPAGTIAKPSSLARNIRLLSSTGSISNLMASKDHSTSWQKMWRSSTRWPVPLRT